MAKRGRPRHPDILTPREWEVLALLREALTNDQIAQRLGITERTAKFHVSEILSKLGVTSRQEAAAWSPDDRRSWRALVLMPLGLLRRAPTWAPPALAVAIVGAVVLGLGALVWGIARTSIGGDRPPTSTGASRPTPTADLSTGFDWQGPNGSLRLVGTDQTTCGDRATAEVYRVPVALDARGSLIKEGRQMLGLEAQPYEYVAAQVMPTDGWAKRTLYADSARWELSVRQNPLWRFTGMARYPQYAEYFLRRLDQPDLLFRYGADVCDPSLVDAEQLRRRTFTISEALPRIVRHREGDYISSLAAIEAALRAQPEGARPVWLELGNSADFAATRGDMRFPQLVANPDNVVWEVMVTLGDEAGPRRPGQELAAYVKVDAATGSGLGWGCCFHVVVPE
jgi:DNA-binding CsgD family transcriptional regulator